MRLAYAGAALGCPKFDGIKSVMHARNNILTGADFAPPPRKSRLQQLFDRLVEILTHEGRP